MATTSELGLIENAALLLALGLLHDLLASRQGSTRHPYLQEIAVGLLGGLVAIAVMLNPLSFGPGIQFDTRSVLLCIAGLFFGTIPALLAALLAGAFRIYLGGDGLWMGLAVIASSAGIGLLWRRLRSSDSPFPSVRELYVLGLVVHGVMLGLMLLLPGSQVGRVLTTIGPAVMLIYPITTAVLGTIIVNRARRAQAGDALRKSEEKFRRLFHDHAAVKLLIDPATGAIADANQAAANYYGWSVEQLTAMRIQDVNVLPPQDIAAEIEQARRQQRIHFEFRHRRADGAVRDVDVYSSRVEVDGREYLHSIVHDVTDKKEAERALRESADHQARLADQLAQAKRLEAVGRLAGGVAHDYNNMLGVILGYADMGLTELPPGSPVHAYLTEINHAARRSADLTQQLLAFSRQQTIAPKVIDLNDAVEGLLKMLRRLIGEDVAVEWRPGDRLYPVRMDLTQIDQILVNLCVNARDAIVDVGRITIDTAAVTLDSAFCAAHPGSLPGAYVRLSVTDTGVGMDAETRERIFEPFFTTKELGKGTGLGLATVYGIVKQNHGVITVDSTPGRGSTFRVYLPKHDAPPDEEEDHRQLRAEDVGGTETVLFVEDEAQLLTLTARMLEQLGYTVLAAHSPEAALNLLRQHSGALHVLVTDVVMPGMNGRELADRVVAARPGLPVLFTSGYTADAIGERGVLPEGVHFIAKPFSALQLAITLREILDGTTSPSP